MRALSPKQTFFRILLILYAGLVAYKSLAPVGGGGGAGGLLLGLLAMHAAAYFGMTFLAAEGFPQSFEQSRLKIIGYVFLFGLAIELLQLPISGHYFSWLDLLANLIGASLAWFEPEVKKLLFGTN